MNAAKGSPMSTTEAPTNEVLTAALTALLARENANDPIEQGVGAGERFRGRLFCALRDAAMYPQTADERIVHDALGANVAGTLATANLVASDAFAELYTDVFAG
jgi:hypothetical protein